MSSIDSDVESEFGSEFESEVEQVTSLIENADLPHPTGELLLLFVTEALNPLSAAAFVLEKCHAGTTHDNRAELLNLVEDWTYIVECGQSRYIKTPKVSAVKLTARIKFRNEAVLHLQSGRLYAKT